MDILGVDVSKAKLDCYLSHGIERKAIRQSTFQVENWGCKIFCVNSLKGVQVGYNDVWLEREGA